MTVVFDWQRVGGIRPSQLMYTFGVGALVDLPNLSVIVGGLDEWDTQQQRTIVEHRLLRAVKAELGISVEELRAPPWMPEQSNPAADWARTGIPVYPFPRWYRCSRCDTIAPVDSGLFKTESNAHRPDWARYKHENCPKKTMGKPPTAVPARFVVACERGHIDEFPWIELAHREKGMCSAPRLKAIDAVTGTRSTSVTIKCLNCEATGGVQTAFGQSAEQLLPQCRGREAHLRRFANGGCNLQVKAMLLGASNAWFPVTKSALAIPRVTNTLGQLVDEHWEELGYAESESEVRALMRRARNGTGGLVPLADYTDADIWHAIAAIQAGDADLEGADDLLSPEWETLTGDSPPRDEDFELNPVRVPPDLSGHIARLVKADRLREVVAMVGFTRVDGPDSGVADDAGRPVNVAPITRRSEPTWVPASEIRGEGIFIQLDEQAITNWTLETDDRRIGELEDAHRRWRQRRKLDAAVGWPGDRYLLLHSLAHMLINELALEAGYAAASIRERIYSAEPGSEGQPMAGILLYTAASDSEGTLGGLVSLAEPEVFQRILKSGLRRITLCSSDPHCADYLPSPEEDTLHGAACHGCLFLPETSCERGNRYLERSALVETIANDGLTPFFPEF